MKDCSAVSTNPGLGYWLRNIRPVRGPDLAFASALFAAFGAWAFGTYLLPAEFVLPFVVILLFVLACFAAMVALRRPARTEASRLSYWDVAGAITFVGICIAALVDPEHLVRLVESTDRGN
jgi:hypothetical protein